MNNFKLSTLALGLVVAAGNASADHPVDQSGVTFSPMIGHYNFDSNCAVAAVSVTVEKVQKATL